MVNKFGAITILAISAVVFSLYSPLAYGEKWTKAECKRVKLIDTWDWDCGLFMDNVSILQRSLSPWRE